ncbi:MAG: LysR substrate-binding domain-containing protein [Pseudomonadota bacterium]
MIWIPLLICHPSLLEGDHPLKTARDLKHHKLLHEDNHDDWTSWLQTAGVTDVDPALGDIMNDSNSLGIAVENCQGVALGRVALIENDLTTGRIAKPFDASIPSPFSYYLVCPKKKGDQQNVKLFSQFVLSEAG